MSCPSRSPRVKPASERTPVGRATASTISQSANRAKRYGAMKHQVIEVLSGKVPIGERTAVEGWVRTRRDSKAGLSFVAVHDGSCFEPLQVVAPAELPEYASVVQKLTSGCAVRVVGEVVASQGKGQAVELRAEQIECVGWVDDPEAYPMQPKR